MRLSGGALGDDEDVLLETRPSWTALVRPCAVATAVLAASVAVFVLWSSAPAWSGLILLAAVLAAAVRVAARVLTWRSTRLVVTSRRVVFRSGVVRRVGREIPVESVQDVSFSQGLLERVARAGSVTVESAGERGALPFLDVPHPEHFQDVVHEAIAIASSRRGGHHQPERVRPPTIPEQIEQLATLCRGGVLTEAEFAWKKAQLLDRM